MSARVWESRVIPLAADVVWARAKQMLWLNLRPAMVAGPVNTISIGDTRTAVYPDGVSWTYKIAEVSELDYKVTLQLVSTDSALSYSGRTETLRVHRVSTDADPDAACNWTVVKKAFVEYTIDFSTDASASAIEDCRLKVRDTLASLDISALSRCGTTFERFASKTALKNSASALALKPTFQQAMLRIKDPKTALPFYTTALGFSLIDKLDFPQWKFSLYFLATLPNGVTAPKAGTKESFEFLWSYPGVVLELTHNYGSESKDGYVYHNSNDPNPGGLRGGFGHIAVNAPDVYAFSAALEKAGHKFKKKPDEGRMKGLAFAYDADRYWVEICSRSSAYQHKNSCNFSQVMLRIKSPAHSIPFYRDYFGMTLVRELHFPKNKGAFSLYFLATITDKEAADMPHPGSPEAAEFVKTLHNPVLELTHNHGTETQKGPTYHSGNADDMGFGHIGFLVDDVYKFSDALLAAGVPFHKKPDDGGMKGLAFALDPDGYRVEIIRRGGTKSIGPKM